MIAQPYNGTAVGTLTYVTGAHGQGLQGTAVGSYAEVPLGAVNFAGDFAVQWKYISTVDEGYQSQFSTNNLNCEVYGYGDGAVYCTFDGTAVNSVGGQLTDSNPHQITIARAGTTIRIYIDSVERGSATVSGANLGSSGTAKILSNYAGGGTAPLTTTVDEYSIWTTATPPACNPCSGSESNLRALYHLDNNLNDSKVLGVTAGVLSVAIGLDFTAASGGTSPYSYQLQSYSGSCASGTFTNDGAALTGQTSTALFARAGATVRCFRVVVTDAASATSNSNSVTAPLGGGMSVN